MKAFLTILLILVSVIAIRIEWAKPDSSARNLWQSAVAPGALSKSHASLSQNCAACHQPIKGVNSEACIACHANNKALLQRQPTAFHASITTCTGCHVEHQGGTRMSSSMDHSLLAKIGHKELKHLGQGLSSGALSKEEMVFLAKTLAPLPPVHQKAEEQEGPAPTPSSSQCPGIKCDEKAPGFSPHAGRSGDAKLLNCIACHATKDKHKQFFGNGCAQCHSLDSWSIADFRHPSLRSTQCAQCHKPPPSHGMMHFSLISRPLAGQLKAQVHQCYLCHQTTSWNDIKGGGWLKHH